jgi:hypothetical protein
VHAKTTADSSEITLHFYFYSTFPFLVADATMLRPRNWETVPEHDMHTCHLLPSLSSGH